MKSCVPVTNAPQILDVAADKWPTVWFVEAAFTALLSDGVLRGDLRGLFPLHPSLGRTREMEVRKRWRESREYYKR